MAFSGLLQAEISSSRFLQLKKNGSELHIPSHYHRLLTMEGGKRVMCMVQAHFAVATQHFFNRPNLV
jgi:hypothetical protein